MAATVISWVAVLALAAAAAGILISRDWRWSLGLLAGQYLAAFWLVTQHWPIGMASVKLVTGWMAIAALGMTRLGVSAFGDAEESFWPQGSTFRLIGGAIMLVIAIAAGPRVEALNPGIGLPVIIGSLLLVGMGLLHLGITSQTLRVVIGLLTVLCGFEIIYAAVESSILVAALLALSNLGLALAGSYLLINSFPAETEEELL
jgi:hypothetical protein